MQQESYDEIRRRLKENPQVPVAEYNGAYYPVTGFTAKTVRLGVHGEHYIGEIKSITLFGTMAQAARFINQEIV